MLVSDGDLIQATPEYEYKTLSLCPTPGWLDLIVRVLLVQS
jgi:hypothetical protein